MQPQDAVSINRRSLDVEDYIDILRRHKGWILGPTFAALVASVVVAFLWPDTYVSSAVIRVVPPQIPESYVPANIALDLQGRINSMEQVILSRATLTNIINTQGLYPKERSRMPLDDVVEMMRRDAVKIGNVQATNTNTGRSNVAAFTVSFSYPNRFIAQKVTNDLVSRFITENMKNTSQESLNTTDFLKEQWDTAKAKLDEYEQKIQTFRARNMGRLPDQMESNMQQLSAMQMQMSNANAAISRVNQEKLLLENQLRIYKDQLNSLKDTSPMEQNAVQRNEKLVEKEREIAAIENALAAARERYKEEHPDVQNLAARLALAKKQREAIAKEDSTKKPDAAPTHTASPQYVRESRDLDAAIKRVTGQIEAKDLEMADLQKDIRRLNQAMGTYQSRIESMPVGDKEYSELLRDRNLARANYEEMDKKMQSSKIASAVVSRKQGETLELLDPPSLPQTPTDPKRAVIVGTGTAIGLLAGLMLAGAREMKDTSLKNLKDVRAYTQLPVLGSIPLLENDLVVRRRRRLGWLAWSTACLVGIVIMSSSVVYYYATKL